MSGSIRATALNDTDRLPGMAEAFGKLPTQSAIIDGELVLHRSPRRGAFLPADGTRCAPAILTKAN